LLYTNDTTPPVWDTTVGICLATDDTDGGSVTVEFGMATDDIDGSNVRYNIYYAPTTSWDALDWSNNSVLLNVFPSAGSGCVNSYTVALPQNDVEYTFGVRVQDQAGNEDSNTNTATATPTGAAIILFDDFSDGNANGWTEVVDSPGGIADWQVSNSIYEQLNDVKGFQESYHLGTYSYYNNGFSLANYRLCVRIPPNINADKTRDTIGVMFRYSDNNNYYRFSMSKFQGFARLEVKNNGNFTTLAVNGRGFDTSKEQVITIDLDGPKILVYLNGDPLFSAVDSTHTTGTVALYALNRAKFDYVGIYETDAKPRIVISNPISHSVEVVDSEPITDELTAAATAGNIPVGGGVEFILDGATSSGILLSEPFEYVYTSVTSGDHSIEARIVDDTGQPISGAFSNDLNAGIGVDGKILIAIGDSITNGAGDNLSEDNNASNGKNFSWGFTPILTDDLSSCLQEPTVVSNEGIGGSKAKGGADRLLSTMERYPKAQYWLILFGTNDANATIFTPSGKSCTEADFQAGEPTCNGTFKQYMRSMILDIQTASQIPLLAKVPFSSSASSEVDLRMQDYNIVIDQLVQEHAIQVVPPDLYSYFKTNPAELADGTHPNGQGYTSVSDLWFNVLIDLTDGIFLCP